MQVQVCRRFLPGLLTVLLGVGVGSLPVTARAGAFEHEIWPVLQARCVECHGPTKQKGGLRLDSAAAITRGGDTGAAFVAGRPEESLLIARVTLPEGDSERMPAKGPALSGKEVESLRAWIAGGADFGGWGAPAAESDSSIKKAWIPEPAGLPARKIGFNAEVRLILSNHCYQCHGPDRNARKADLRIDVREEALAERKGIRAIVPGEIEKSEMIRRIFSDDPAERMPPAEAEKPLNDDQRKILAAWVAQGAEYERHWAYLPPQRAAAPATDGGANPIDGFIRATLAAQGLKFSPQADPAMLIRRLSFDLTGLPPEPGLVAEFAANPSDATYHAIVDRMLASPAFGERMAMDWLDQVRFADTNGYHSDNTHDIYPYRDWVIRAFNENKRFDEFTIEQLAGDLMPGATLETRTASAFNRLNQITEEGGAQPMEYRAKHLADRVRAVGSVWLGATLGCAECHDHKFDPYKSRDFYSLGAFFADIKESDIATQANRFGPLLHLPDAAGAEELLGLDLAINRLERETRAPSRESMLGQYLWEEAILSRPPDAPLGWMPCRPSKFTSRDGQTLTLLDDLSVLASGELPQQDLYEFTLGTDRTNLTGIRLEALSDDSFFAGVVRNRQTYWVNEIEFEAAPPGSEEFAPVKIAEAKATSGIGPVANAIDGDLLTAWWAPTPLRLSPAQTAVFRFESPIAGGAGTRIRVRIMHFGGAMYMENMFGRLRFSLTDSPEVAIDKIEGVPEFARNALLAGGGAPASEREAIARFWLTASPEKADQRKKLLEARRAKDSINDRAPTVMTSVHSEPRPTRILPRGNWQREDGELVQPAIPAFLGTLDTHGGPATRLDLARWIVDPKNPLTSRVVMNRAWGLFFGTGISKVLDDLGSQGEWPTHPALLDWLAVEFVESGWDVKHMIRLIVTSETYRQNSVPTAEMRETDPYNRLLARQTPRRLQAEMVRDNALFVSGLLNPALGGPSFKPYQPEGYWDNLNFPPRKYKHDEGAEQYRRGLYIHWQRSFLHPSLLAFDASSREECTAQRPASNTPQQALVLLNDPTYVEAARVLAARVIREGGSAKTEKIGWLFKQVLAREPSSREELLLLGLLAKHRDEYSANPEAAAKIPGVGYASAPEGVDPVDLAAWTSVARAMLNLHETITRS